MNHKRIHDTIIERAVLRNWTRKSSGCYVENHHILPRSLGGNNQKENVVFLTAKEHYMIHLLMTKFYTGLDRDKMVRAFCRMCKGNSVFERIVTPRTYQILREEYSRVVSRQVSGKNHPMYGKRHTVESREKMRILRFERIQNGTNEGNRKPHSIETKEKQRQVKLGKKHTEDHNKKIGISNLGRIFSEQTRKKISDKRKLYWEQKRKTSLQSIGDF